jgi:hypothetical protein
LSVAKTYLFVHRFVLPCVFLQNSNTRFAMFLLKANHGMAEKDLMIAATQNSFMGISPDLLADALELMGSKERQ